MDITTRNFFNLLRAGAFNEKVEIEPMSAWKWRQVYHYSLMHGVSAIVYDGIMQCQHQFFLQIPTDILDMWRTTTNEIEHENENESITLLQIYSIFSKQLLRPILVKGYQLAALYNQPLHRLSHSIDIYFPYSTQGEKADKWALQNGDSLDNSKPNRLSYKWNNSPIEHYYCLNRMTNKLLNRSLQNIIETEIRESTASYIIIKGTRVEVVSNTLALLQILLDIAQHILNNGISLKHLVDLGSLLRSSGDKVDYVKLQNWIERLSMKSIAQLAGALLVELFNFTEDEIPFMQPNKKSDTKRVKDELFQLQNSNQEDWHFKQGKDIFIHASNSSAMMGQVRRSVRYFKFYPSESITNFFSSFTHSLSHIEE
ncbi:nucleotidyltransferase family protein [Prevotella sp. E9-3]|uniref:nucleotidyltransferase family protein n=1 Tax=Prevotella sp. E9-3 TaxID=2913621 RepID=UPI001EDBC970|nr:nucleotidyltransferase family protein [Prevotella sp. E9-3]UKK47006.1 nucleotidyltransferase family protein [Prevotella sp. E9-3]